jgi:hypothetical protein
MMKERPGWMVQSDPVNRCKFSKETSALNENGSTLNVGPFLLCQLIVAKFIKASHFSTLGLTRYSVASSSS